MCKNPPKVNGWRGRWRVRKNCVHTAIWQKRHKGSQNAGQHSSNFFFSVQLWNDITLASANKLLWDHSLLMLYVAPVRRYSWDVLYLLGHKTTELNKGTLKIGKNEYKTLSENHSGVYGLFLKKNHAYFKTTF